MTLPPPAWNPRRLFRLAALVGIGLGGLGAVVDRVAAVVDDQVIALSEVYEIGGNFITQRCGETGADPACLQDAELEILDALIQRKLMELELAKLDMTVTGADIDAAIDQIIQQNGFADRQDLRTQVESQGMRWDAYREQLAQQLAQQRFQGRVLQPRIAITEDELRDRYTRTVRGPEKLTVSLHGLAIIIPSDATPELTAEMVDQATALVGAINEGRVSWTEAIAKYDAANLDGVLANRRFAKGDLVPALDKVVFDFAPGKTEGPIQAGNLIFIVQVVDRATTAETGGPSFEDVKDQLKSELLQEKLDQAAQEWYQQARRETPVEILLGDAG